MDGNRSHRWTRFLLLRLLGWVYLFAFLALVFQVEPLLGSRGLTPAALFLRQVSQTRAGARAWLALPSLFWWRCSDAVLLGAAWIGVGLSVALLLGLSNRLLLLALWALYLSFIHVGQIWYGYGWEIQLTETGFLAAFLVPWSGWRPLAEPSPPLPVIWLFRWLIVRVMLGAALIKLRGDACWRDLSCLFYHFETQPLPNPLSPWFNALPHWALRGGVLFNFAAELAAPFFVLIPWRRGRAWAGCVMAAFQCVLILSGNLSFLNWLTLVPILACFDDGHWAALGSLARRPARGERGVGGTAAAAVGVPGSPGRLWRAEAWALLALVAFLSRGPVENLLSRDQAMNTSFGPLDLVNTYGAFGSVGQERPQLVVEGTRDPEPGPSTVWTPYVFKCQPGPLDRRPCVCAPYQYRLDWQAWFAAMERPGDEPWVFPLVWKLLRGDADVLSLFAADPFPGTPPRFVRVRLFRYRFAPLGHPGGAWWTRQELGLWLPPLSLDDPRLREILMDLDREDLLAGAGAAHP